MLDRADNSVVVFDSTGAAKARFGRRGRGPGEFLLPVDVAIDEQGRVLVLDYELRRLSRFSPQGLHLSDVSLSLSQPIRILAEASGAWVLSSSATAATAARLTLVGEGGHIVTDTTILSSQPGLPRTVPSIFRDGRGGLIIADDRPGLWDVWDGAEAPMSMGTLLVRDRRESEVRRDAYGQRHELPPDAATVAVIPLEDKRLVWYWTTDVADVELLRQEDLVYSMAVMTREGTYIGQAQLPEGIKPLAFYAAKSTVTGNIFVHVNEPAPMVVELRPLGTPALAGSQ